MVSKLGHAPGFTSHRLSQGLRSVPFVSAGCELLVVSPLSCLVMDWWVCLVVSDINSSMGQGKRRGFPWDKLFQLGNIFVSENSRKPPIYVLLLNFHCHSQNVPKVSQSTVYDLSFKHPLAFSLSAKKVSGSDSPRSQPSGFPFIVEMHW